MHNTELAEYILESLGDLESQIRSKIPKFQKEQKYVSLFYSDVSPKDLGKFMKENNIPETADFDGSENGYDSWDDFGLSWEIEIPMTEELAISIVKSKFNRRSYGHVMQYLKSKGYTYKQFSYRSRSRIKEDIFEFYKSNSIDKLVGYFSEFINQ